MTPVFPDEGGPARANKTVCQIKCRSNRHQWFREKGRFQTGVRSPQCMLIPYYRSLFPLPVGWHFVGRRRIHGTGYDGDVPTRQHAGPGAAGPDVPEPSLAERARTLVSVARAGSLSTHSRKVPGFPFGSVMPFAADDHGRLVFFISTMAMHTQNLHQDARASLLITQPDSSNDPLGAARVTLLGNTTEVPAAEVRDLYLSRHENARYWQEYSDFAYHRLQVSSVYFIGGFGVMGWVPGEEYAAARPDPLSDAAEGIIRHMNADHPEALVLIAHRFAGEAAAEASMTAVDRLGFHLRLRTGDRIHGRRVAFPREVRSKDEARAIFIEMVRETRSPDSN